MAAFLERAAEMTQDPDRRARRALEAAQAKLHAGAFDAAAALLAMAETGPPDELRLARIDLLHARIAFVQNRGNEAPPLMLAAARTVGGSRPCALPGDLPGCPHGGDFRRSPGSRPEAARDRARRRVSRQSPSGRDCPTECWTPSPCVSPTGTRLRRRRCEQVLRAICEEEIPAPAALRWLWLGSVIAGDLWDDEHWHVVAARHVEIVRDAGALSELPGALDSLAYVHLIAGEPTVAASLYRGGQDGVCRDREHAGTCRSARTGCVGRSRARGPLTDRRDDERGRTAWTGVGRDDHALVARGALQRPRSVRGSGGGRRGGSQQPGGDRRAPKVWSSWSRQPFGAARPSRVATRSNVSRRRRRPVAQTGRSVSRRGRARL